jgi:hypothetical protein
MYLRPAQLKKIRIKIKKKFDQYSSHPSKWLSEEKKH